jgi:hypothetical protein
VLQGKKPLRGTGHENVESLNDPSIMHWDDETRGRLVASAEYNSAIQQITNLRYEGTVHGKPSIFLKHASRP